MDIWRWVQETREQLYESGHDRLADIMDDLPGHACDDEHDDVDRLYAEGLPLARAHSNKWIEVFVRHWYLQSQVLHRRNSRGCLSEAIDLLEFSHRDDTRDCPQTVCVVQDLANCYGVRDGPGFVPERLAVCNETLERINPAWPCYRCISCEIVEAHLDNGDPEEALTLLHKRRGEILKTGTQPDSELELMEAECLLRLGRLEEAESVARKATNEYGGESFVADRKQAIALILTRQKRFDDAQEFMLTFNDIVATMARYSDWHQIMFDHALHDAQLNSLQLDYHFAELVRRAVRNGAVRLALTIASRRAELGLARRDAFACARALEQTELAIAELNRDAGARASTDVLAARVAELTAQRHGEVNPLTLESACDDSQPAPNDLFELQRLHAAHPDHAPVARVFADALQRLGYDERCTTFCREFLDQHPTDERMLSLHGHTLLDQNRLQEFDEQFGAMDAAALPDNAAKVFHWVCARRWHTPEPTRALDHLQAILTLNPQSRGALSFAAQLERDRDQYAAALEHYERLIEVSDEPDSAHWDRLITATLAERWDLVRASCAALEMELSNDEGPVIENWGIVRIRFHGDDDTVVVMPAQRTGPVSARVIGVAEFGAPQYYDQHIVFEARPLNQLDQKDDEGYMHDSEGYYNYLYEAVRRSPGQSFFFFTVDGMYPGDEAWEALCTTLGERGLIISRRSSEAYTLIEPETQVEQVAVYAIVGVPDGHSLDDVQLCLVNETGAYAHPLIWPHLATELEDAAMLATQADIEARYGIT